MADPVTTAGFSTKLSSINLRSFSSTVSSPSTPQRAVESSYIAERPYRDYQLKVSATYIVSPSIFKALKDQLDIDGFDLKRGLLSSQAIHQPSNSIYSKFLSSLTLNVFPSDLSTFDLSKARSSKSSDIFASSADYNSKFDVRRLHFRNAYMELLASLDQDFIESFYVYLPQKNESRYILITKKSINGALKITAAVSDVSLETLHIFRKALPRVTFLETVENVARVSTPLMSRPSTPGAQRMSSPLTSAMTNLSVDSPVPSITSPQILQSTKSSFFIVGKSEITQYISYLERNLPSSTDVPYLLADKSFYRSTKLSCPVYFNDTNQSVTCFGIEIEGMDYVEDLRIRNTDQTVNPKRLPIPMNCITKAFSALCDEYSKLDDSHVLEVNVNIIKAASLFNVEFKNITNGLVEMYPFDLVANGRSFLFSPTVKVVKPQRKPLTLNSPLRSPTTHYFNDDDDDELAELTNQSYDLRPPLTFTSSNSSFADAPDAKSLKTPLASRTISSISFCVADSFCKIKL